MARNRLAKILKSMAARKDLKITHYKVYLCLFAGVQDGSVYTKKDLVEITGMNERSVQRALKEMSDAGNISRDKNGVISLNFDPGIGGDKVVASGAISEKNGLSPSQSQSMLSEYYNIYYISPDRISYIRNKKRNINDISLKIIDLPKEDLLSPDIRFKKVVDGIFEIYEKETGEKLNVLFKAADGAMIKRMLTKLPEEAVGRLLESFRNFVTTTDRFDAEQVRQTPVRYWATRVTKWLPEKELDFDKMRANMLKKENE